MNRRSYVKFAGMGVVPLSGCSFGPDDDRVEFPLDSEHWELAFEDTFDAGSLDTTSWDVGWGWGRNTTMSPTRITPENVSVRDGRLRIRGTHDEDDILSGAINSKGKVTFGPGSYVEARIKFAGREGFQNAFWTKPNSEAWPPEIDVVELWQDGSGRTDVHESQHNLHFSRSTRPGDRSTYAKVGASHDGNGDLTEEFRRYGVHWGRDRISHFVDGERVSEFTVGPMLEAMRNGVPFYMMFSLNINNIGTADTSEPWNEEMVVDWIRVWTQ